MKQFLTPFFPLLALLFLIMPALAVNSSMSELDRLDPISQAPSISERPSITPIAPLDPVEQAPGAPEPVLRQSGQGNINDIERHWNENGWPAFVSYAYEADRELTGGLVSILWEIGLTENTQERQQEVLALVSSACLVEFRDARFSYAERVSACEALSALAQTDDGLLEIVFPRNDDSVWVVVPEEQAEEYARRFARDYGEIVTAADQTSLETAGILPGSPVSQSPETENPEEAVDRGLSAVPPEIWLCLILAAVTVAVLVALALRGFRTPSAKTGKQADNKRFDE